jgi:HD-like signal output (HDOD) protein
VTATLVPVRVGTLLRVAAPLAFYRNWDTDDFRAIEPHTALLDLDANDDVLTVGQVDPYDYFLIEGELNLAAEGGSERRLKAGELDAGFPVAHLRPSRYRVRTQTPCRLLRVEQSRVKQPARRRRARFKIEERAVDGSFREHQLVDDFMGELAAGRVQLPSLPSIAVKIRRAVAAEDFDMGKLATIIGADPAIAARLIKIANSATFRGESPCDSLRTALVRLGVDRTQNIVVSLAMRGLYQADQPHIRERMLKSWRHAVEIAATAAVLARLSPGLAEDRAMLVGLLHEIGAVPLLQMAGDYLDLEDTPGVIDEIVGALTPEVSSTILTRWQFHERFAEAAMAASNWYHDAQPEASYTDLIVIAHLHALVRHREFEKLPRIDETPAFGKLAVGVLSPQLSLLVLDEARGKIQELRTLLA